MSVDRSKEGLCRVKATSQGSLGAVGGLSNSHQSKLKVMFPDGPQHTGPTGPAVTIDGFEGNLGGTGDRAYGKVYRSAVMRGHSTALLSGEVVDMSFGTSDDTTAKKIPPSLSSLTPPDLGSDGNEATQGLLGSTISFSGIGPNLNPLPVDDISAREMSDYKPVSNPVDTKSPLDTSTSLTSNGLPPVEGEGSS